MRRGPGSLRRFRSAADTRARGRLAELAAQRWLEARGFRIVDTNYRAKPGEIDIIARQRTADGEYLCFIEIKARLSGEFGGARAAVPPRKQRRIVRAAKAYLMCHDWQGPCRFDVLCLEARDRVWHFDLVRNAFWAQ